MPDDKCTACSYDSTPLVGSSPYLTALSQVAAVDGDVDRVVSWMCPAHRDDFKAIVDTLKQVPEALPPERTP